MAFRSLEGPESFLTGVEASPSSLEANCGMGTQFSLVSKYHLKALKIGVSSTGLSQAQGYIYSQRLWHRGSWLQLYLVLTADFIDRTGAHATDS